VRYHNVTGGKLIKFVSKKTVIYQEETIGRLGITFFQLKLYKFGAYRYVDVG
jgi:hypothetical protein